MDKDKFNSLPILEQLEYINGLLAKGESLRGISAILSIDKSTFSSRFRKIGYVYNPSNKQYDKDNTLVIKEYKSITKVLPQVKEVAKQGIVEGITEVSQKYDKDILELLKYKDDILEMLKDYKSNTKIIEVQQLDINSLPSNLKGEIVNKSIKVYGPVFDLFNSLYGDYRAYKKQDIISMALYKK